MASRTLIRAVAKTAAATAFGGPIAGAGAGVSEAIDLITGRLGQRDRDAYTSAVERLERDLGAFGRSEGLSRASVDRALEEAQAVIAAHGLVAAEMVDLDLDPDRVSAMVLRRGAKQRRFVGEATRELSRQVVRAVYGALLEDDAGVPGQDAAFRRAVLGRLRDLDRQVAAAPVPAAGPAPADLREVFRACSSGTCSSPDARASWACWRRRSPRWAPPGPADTCA